VKSPRGRLHYDNELQVGDGGIVVTRTEEGCGRLTPATVPIDLRKVIGKPFNLGRVSGTLKPLGAAIPVRFQSRALYQYSESQHIGAHGMGSVQIKVVRAERKQKPGGGGSTPAGPGKTWLIVHLSPERPSANFVCRKSFYQLPFGYDPGPTFFLTDAAVAVYWPDGADGNPITIT